MEHWARARLADPIAVQRCRCMERDGCAIVVIRLADVDAELRLGCGTDRAVVKPDPVLGRGVVAMEELQLLPPDEVLIGHIETLLRSRPCLQRKIRDG